MRDQIEVRFTREADMQAHCDIVNPYIETTTINFRTEPQTPDEWREDWKRHNERHPWLVAVDGGTVVGVAYATPWKPRPAYNWTAETTVYVREGRQGRGTGRMLYGRLLDLLDAQGFRSQIGVIALPNAASVALHEALSFAHAGTLEGVGHKMDRWHSTGLWQRQIQLPETRPAPTLPVSLVTKTDASGTRDDR